MFTEIETPPDYEVWADQSYHKIQEHLKKQKIPYFQDLNLTWIAAPYFSLWKGSNKEGTIWVLHNDLVTDAIVDKDLTQNRQALAFFAYRWQHGKELTIGKELQATPGISWENLYGNMVALGNILKDTVEDGDIWD